MASLARWLAGSLDMREGAIAPAGF